MSSFDALNCVHFDDVVPATTTVGTSTNTDTDTDTGTGTGTSTVKKYFDTEPYLYMSFEPTEGTFTEFTVTLGSARLYAQKLRAANTESDTQTNTMSYGYVQPVTRRGTAKKPAIVPNSCFTLQSFVDSNVGGTNFVDTVNITLEKHAKKLEKKRLMSRDICLIEEEIHNANAKSGISLILKKEDFVHAQLSMLKSMLSSVNSAHKLSNAESVYNTYVSRAESSTSSLMTSNLNVAMYDTTQIERAITHYTKVLRELEETRKEKNALCKVTIRLSEPSVRALGF